MKELWTAADPSFSGEFFSFSGVKLSPKPAQKPHPPIWIGGQSNAALRRVARLGDGWHPIAMPTERLGERSTYLRARLDESARSLDDITISVRLELDVLPTGAQQRGLMEGAPDHLLRTVDTYARSGVGEMVLTVSTDEMPRIERVMEDFATQVMPKTSG